jgi:hypothetical protein
MTRLAALLLLAALAGAADLAGKWNFVWSTPGGERRSSPTFRVSGENVELDMPGAKAPIKGTLKGDNVEVRGTVYSPEAGSDGEFKLSGKLEAGKLSGSASWGEHPVTFTATRAE